MTDLLTGFPAEVAGKDPVSGAVRLMIDEALYPLEAVYGAAYIFIDRAWVLLDRPEFALLFALVYPQRLTSDLVLFLDDSLRLSFGGSSQS